MSIIGLGHWAIHDCDKRGDRNNDNTVVIMKVIRTPDTGWPNMGQFQFNLKDKMKQGFFINYCPYCSKELRYKVIE